MTQKSPSAMAVTTAIGIQTGITAASATFATGIDTPVTTKTLDLRLLLPAILRALVLTIPALREPGLS